MSLCFMCDQMPTGFGFNYYNSEGLFFCSRNCQLKHLQIKELGKAMSHYFKMIRDRAAKDGMKSAKKYLESNELRKKSFCDFNGGEALGLVNAILTGYNNSLSKAHDKIIETPQERSLEEKKTTWRL